MADMEKLRRTLEDNGFATSYFETAQEAAAYLDGKLDGKSIGVGGCLTAQQMGLDKLLPAHNTVHWHWMGGSREDAAQAEVYISSVNGLAETGEIVNIDGTGNRLAANFYGHKRLYIVAGINKIEPTLERAIWRARNIAAPLRARGMGMDTPCAKGELKCYDCRSPQRLCRGLGILMEPMMGMEKAEIVIIGEELGG